MQIHELNNYNGDLNGSAFMAVDDGEDTGKISVAGLLADINKTVNELGEDLNGRIDNIIAGGTAPSAAEVTDARRATDGIVYPSLGDAIRGQIEEVESEDEAITRKLLRVESDNLLESDSVMTSGYVAQNGTAYAGASYSYTPKIPVNEGDQLRGYSFAAGAFTQKRFRFVCAYDAAGNPVSSAGTEETTVYTVPSGIRFVVLTLYGGVSGSSEYMVTKNKAVTDYEAYFAPYYIASEEFIKEALGDGNLPESTVKGYNLLPGEHGEGYYFGSSIGSKINFSESASYHYAIVPVKPNTDYYINTTPRFIVLTDDNDTVLWFAETYTKRFLNTGEATKLYYSIDSSSWNNASLYGESYRIIVAEGFHGTFYNEKKPLFISGLSQNMTESKYGCALPRRPLIFTTGTSQKWYFANFKALQNNVFDVSINGFETFEDDGISFVIPETPISTGGNGYFYYAYDSGLVHIAQQSQLGFTSKNKNLQNCTILAIGDSTIANGLILRDIANNFNESNKTAAFLGTRGTAPYKNEGRSGWSAKQYCTVAARENITNAFFNPATEKFDFSYYMSQQGYTSPDFVIIQLGINDLYNTSFIKMDDAIIETAGYILEIIDSILEYNSSQKILINLPTAMNGDPSKHSRRVLDLLRNRFVRLNDYTQLRLTEYSTANVRSSYCHLILDPNSDISDDVHPTDGGYKKMADEITSQINCWQN